MKVRLWEFSMMGGGRWKYQEHYQLIKTDLRPAAVPDEPPCVPENCHTTNIYTDEEVSDK